MTERLQVSYDGGQQVRREMGTLRELNFVYEGLANGETTSPFGDDGIAGIFPGWPRSLGDPGLWGAIPVGLGEQIGTKQTFDWIYGR